MIDKHNFITEMDDPIDFFQAWLHDAESKAKRMGDVFPNAMSVATADKNGQPSVRVLLLKHVDKNGFVFYTNTQAQKGRELLQNPVAELCFYWPFLGRQVRVNGSVTSVSDRAADAYFATRNRESQIGAWASQQSEMISGRDALMERFAEFDAKFSGQDVPRPDHWSGYNVTPTKIEFWQLGEHRLHDRFLFERSNEMADWAMQRLCP